MKKKCLFKKLFAGIMAAVLLLCVAPLAGIAGIDLIGTKAQAYGETQTEGIFSYVLYGSEDNYEATITGCDENASGDILIPATLGGYKVTSIYSNAFDNCTKIENINVAEDNTMYSSIDGVLYNKEKTVLRRYPIANKRTSYTIPNGTLGIADSAFRYCTNVENVIMPDTVIETGIGVFLGSKDIKSIKLSNGLSKINNELFISCESLEEITIGKNITYIGEEAFRGCKSLKKITVPESVNDVGEFAFAECSSLEEAVFNCDISVLRQGMFSECWALKSFVIPENVTVIGYEAFAYCTSLKTLNIPAAVEEMGVNPFSLTFSLESITISPENKNFVIEDGVLFNKDKTELMQYPAASKKTEYVVPDGVVKIATWAFAKAKNLEKLTIPDSVTTIGAATFYSEPESGYISKLADVYYTGTQEQWNEIAFENYNENIANVIIHYNYVQKWLTDEKTGVSVAYYDDCFNENVKLSVEELSGASELGGIYFTDGKSNKQIGFFNIKMVNDKNEACQPNSGKQVTLKIKIPEQYKNRKDFTVYHWLTNGGREKFKTSENQAWIENGYILFNVKSFSPFALYAESATELVKTPAKKSYAYKENLDLSGIELSVIKADGTPETVTDTSKMQVSGYDSSKIGEQTVTVTYEGDSVEFKVNVQYSWWQWIIRILFLGFLWY